jgi:hypothetical protein
MAHGLTNAGLSEELCLSATTVEGHVRSILGRVSMVRLPGVRGFAHVPAISQPAASAGTR